MLKILIIEDEEIIAHRLVQLLDQIEVDYQLCGIIGSVQGTIAWLTENEHPDLIFADIQLSDGNSFTIFKAVEVKSKIIFTTSYDEFALDAFKVNSIDYLLKPITAKKLKNSFAKLEEMTLAFANNESDEDIGTESDQDKISSLLDYLDHKDKGFRNRFLIKMGNSYKSITAKEIAYFYVSNKTTYLKTFSKKKYSLDTPLDELDKELNSKLFFRINRQMIININSIHEIHTFFNSRLLLNIEPPFDEDVLVTRSNIAQFKEWMNS
jgi:DNA-binding LytR/AlgR family response regulator